jgi:NADH dehydrogenase
VKDREQTQHRVVIVGGGFGGLNAARQLTNSPVHVTLIDKRNFHLFQPLLYQVATGSLSPGDIAYPIRWIFSREKNIEVLNAEVVDILPDEKRVLFRDGELEYDSLILATGSRPHYYNHADWEERLPGLKSLEDAVEIRRQILLAFEAAERESDPEPQRAWMHFVILGGGPTGVELAGAIVELARETMKGEFQHIDLSQTRITLLEMADRILSSFPEELSTEARQALTNKGVTVRTGASFVDAGDGLVTILDLANGELERFPAQTVIWAAGVKASPLGELIAKHIGAKTDRNGRIIVNPDLSVPGYPSLFVVGDLAHFAHQTGTPLLGVAQVAIQQGKYAARQILARLQGKELASFRYKDKGTLAVIGRNAAIADLGKRRLSGFFGWLIWAFVHISFLIGFDNKLLVFIQWAWYYFTRKRGARLIIGRPNLPLLESTEPATDAKSWPLAKQNSLASFGGGQPSAVLNFDVLVGEPLYVNQ